MKKVFLVFLISFILILSPFTVFADELPEDDLNGEFAVVMTSLSLTGGVIQEIDYSFSHTFPTGQVGVLSFIPQNDLSSQSGGFQIGYGLDLTVTHTCDLYFLYSTSESLGSGNSVALVSSYVVGSDFSLTSFSPYYEYFDLFTYNGSFYDTSVFYSLDDSSLVFSSSSSSSMITSTSLGLGVIRNLEPNNYLFQFRGTVFSTFGNFSVPMGFFIDDRFSGSNRPDSPDPILSYESGFISFQQSADEIRQSMNSVLSDPNSTDFEKQISIQIADSQLEQLQSISDSKFSQVVNAFDSDSEALLDSVISSGTTAILDSVSDLNILYTDALTQATSPDQGILINTQYSVRLQQLQTVFDVNYKKELDDVLSDRDLLLKEDSYAVVDDLLEIESSARSIFEDSDYESYLTFNNWLLDFDDDLTVYRSIFEFLFEDPRSEVVQPYLIIPFSLVIVGVLLATTTVVFKGGKNG